MFKHLCWKYCEVVRVLHLDVYFRWPAPVQPGSSTTSSTSLSSDDTNTSNSIQVYDHPSGSNSAELVEILDTTCEISVSNPRLNGLVTPSFTMQQFCKVDHMACKEDSETMIDMVVSDEFESENARVVLAAETLLSMATAVRSRVSVCSGSPLSGSTSAEGLLNCARLNNKRSFPSGDEVVKLDECWKRRKTVLSAVVGNDPQTDAGSCQMEEIPMEDDPDMLQFQHEAYSYAFDSSGNRIHKCVICGRVFTVLAAFKVHVTTHMKQRNKCPICGKYFSRSWLLKGHMRIHTGERPYRCDFPGCHRAFADKSNLRSHSLIHTANGKNYVCPKCNRAFAQKRYLHKHRLEVCKI